MVGNAHQALLTDLLKMGSLIVNTIYVGLQYFFEIVHSNQLHELCRLSSKAFHQATALYRIGSFRSQRILPKQQGRGVRRRNLR